MRSNKKESQQPQKGSVTKKMLKKLNKINYEQHEQEIRKGTESHA